MSPEQPLRIAAGGPAAFTPSVRQHQRPAKAADLSPIPTPHAQTMLLGALWRDLEPVRRAYHLPAVDVLPGLRLRRLFGRCDVSPGGKPLRILVRCTATGNPRAWRPRDAIVVTLLHEMAHLRQRGHGPTFWALLRNLLDHAARLGVYTPGEEDEGAEQARGDEKLRGSAADAVAQAARARRVARAAATRQAVKGWTVGTSGRVTVRRGPLAGAVVRVIAIGRSRLTVEGPDGRRYWVSAMALEPLSAG